MMMGLSIVTLSLFIPYGFAAYDGTCVHSTFQQRNDIREKVQKTLASKGYAKRLNGEVKYEQSFNPSSEDVRFMFKRPTEEFDFPWYGDTGWAIRASVFGLQMNLLAPSSDPTSLVHQLNESEVVLWIGCNPPLDPAGGPQYYGLTNYLAFFDEKTQWSPWGADGDTINQVTMKHTGNNIWGSASAIIWTADEVSAADTVAALKEAGFPKNAINVQVVPSQLQNVRLGLGPEYNFWSIAGRIALWKPSTLKEEFMNFREPMSLFSANNRTQSKKLFPTTPLLARSSEPTEQSLYTSLKQTMVDAAIAHAKSDGWELVDGTDMQPLMTLRGDWYINGTKCIEDPTKSSMCFMDTQDSAYFDLSQISILDFYVPFAPGCNQLALVVGIDHQASGYATYSSLALQSVGASSQALSNVDWQGSGQAVAPDVEGSDKAFVVELRRSCLGNSTACMAVPLPGKFAARAYLNKATGTGPDPFQLVPARVLRFKKGLTGHTCYGVATTPGSAIALVVVPISCCLCLCCAPFIALLLVLCGACKSSQFEQLEDEESSQE